MHDQSALCGLRVALYGSGGSAFHHAALAAYWGASVRPISGSEIRAGALTGADVLVMPGGGANAMAGLCEPLGTEGANAVQAFVRAGGSYIGSCAGAFLPAHPGAAYDREHPIAAGFRMVNASIANMDDGQWAGLRSPGVGTVLAENARPSHWLARGLPPYFHMVHYNGPMFTLGAMPNPVDVGSGTGVITLAGVTAEFTPGERMFGSDGGSELFVERAAQDGIFAVVEAEIELGLVVLFGSHPEFGLDPIQLQWGDSVLLFRNALQRQAIKVGAAARPSETGIAWQNEAAPDEPRSTLTGGKSRKEHITKALEGSLAALLQISREFSELEEAGLPAAARLGPLPSFMGRSPERVWVDVCAAASEAASCSAVQLERWLGDGLVTDAMGEALPAVERWLLERPGAGQDYGFSGLAPLLDRVIEMMNRTSNSLLPGSARVPKLRHAYDALEDHPYQLAVSSYLSAAGLTAAAALVVATLGSLVGRDATELRGVLWR